MKHIILASASPRRKEILELADLKFDVMPSDAQEITTKTAPNEVVMELASIKAKDIYKKSEKQSMVVGADTVVAYQGQILGKPADEADAKRMLTMLSGQTHEVYTGVCVIEDGKTKTFYEETKVTFYGSVMSRSIVISRLENLWIRLDLMGFKEKQLSLSKGSKEITTML